MAAGVTPPPPPGFVLQDVPPPPPGFAIENGQPAAAPQPANQPPPTPFTPSGERSAFRDAMSQFDEALKAITNLNPQTAMFRAAGDGMKSATDLIEKGAYSVGGTVTDIAANAGVSPEIAGGAGLAANVVTQAIPTVIGALTGSVAKQPIRSGAEFFMRSALKPDTRAMLSGKGDKAVATMLDEGINVTTGGVEKLQGRVDKLNSAIEQAIKGSGATVDKNAVASRLQDLVGRIEKTQATPQDALKAVEKVYTEFMSNGIIPKNIPVQQAQELKQGIYQFLKDSYGQLGSASVESQKALARGMKEEIARAVPEVSKLNAKESELLNALILAEKRAAVSGNKNPAGLAFLATNPKAAAAFLADRSELFKSVVARLMNTASKGAVPLGAAAGAAVGYEGAQAP